MNEFAAVLPSVALAGQPAAAEPRALPSEDREARLFWKLRYRVARTQLGQLFTNARLRTTLVVGLSLFFWLGLFLLFYEAFTFIVTYVGQAGATYHALTVRFVFHLFFASLNVMLVFSSGIVLYTGLYRSPETRYLLAIPARPERIVLYKFQEAVFFSSWGFFLLASPIMIAYGIVVAAPWHYFALLVPLIISFVYIPCGIGALCCLLIVHKLSRMRAIIVGGAALAVIVLATHSVWQTVHGPQAMLFGTEWFQETLHRFRVTEQEWLPSSWLTNGLLEAARRPQAMLALSDPADLPVIKASFFLVLLISNAMFLHVLVTWAAKHWFRPSYANFASRRVRRRYMRTAMLDRLAGVLLFAFPRPLQLLLLKDWRLLRRDPVQWLQFLIFFGLLVLYFLNMDRFNNPRSEIDYVTWVNVVSFLNLTVVGLILSTFTTRFIFPMISLEGQCFWILGLLPIKRDTILWSKFYFASLGSWIPCSLLILLSDIMLHVSPIVIAVHQLTCILLCLGLASIAVGCGAMLPDFRETSPSKIAAGFGGTLNLVLSALYIMVIVVLTALPCHFYVISGRGPLGNVLLSPHYLKMWLAIGIGASIVIGALATIVPLQRGLRAFRKLQFE